MDIYEYQAKIFKALAHPIRLGIIKELAKKEKCVSELAKQFRVDISTISRHLNQLKEAGIISARKEKQNIFYELKMRCVVEFMKCVVDLKTKSGAERI